ncbi:MAG: malto-oligosyltrehalose trehalohydrolase [Actinobacteria bacterium]|nr:malto-oligosyltrehalose trehalohydrolase [Actinomycetota bacterium]
MTTIRLWAPGADRADLVLGTESLPMSPTGDGHYTIDVPPGTDYLLSVDGREPRPDPRSAWQPYGVHDASRAFDVAAHAWTDSDWGGIDVLGAVFYELHIGTFTPDGTLDAAIAKLDHLRDLGIDIVELMPVAAFPGRRGWGYDGVDLYAVHEAYGGPAALQRFVDAAHQRGLGVALDVVYNHLGASGNYLAEFGPYFTERHQTPWGAGLNLDGPDGDGVRAYVVDNALRWFRDFHLDALRLDAVHAIQDDSPTHILAEIAARVAELEQEVGRPLGLVAESDLNDVAMVTPIPEGGYGMDAQWADDVHHALHAWLTGETFGYYVDFGSADVLAHALRRVFVHEGGHSTFRGRDWGRPVPDDTERRRFVTFAQNHDQVGNRALGDRPEARLEPGTIAGGAALLLLSPFSPMLFQGQEWGTRSPFQFFTDHGPDLAEIVVEGRKQEFAGHGWEELYGGDVEVPSPQDPATFERSKLPWDEVDDPGHAAMLAWYRDLIALRRSAFGDGATDQHPEADHGDGWFRMTRGPLSVVVAPGPEGRQVAEPAGTALELIFGDVTVSDDGVVSLPAHGVAVLRRPERR